MPQPLWWSTVCVAMRALMRGDLVEAEPQIFSAAAVGQRTASIESETGGAEDVAWTLAQQIFMLRFEQGRIGEIESAICSAVEQNPDVVAWRAVLALAYVSMDRLDDARDEFDVVVRHLGDPWLNPPADVTTRVLASDVCSALNDAPAAAALYDQILPYQRTIIDVGWRVSLGSADRALGLLAATTGRHDEAQRHFEEALAMNDRMSARPWLAFTQLNYGEMLLRRGSAGDLDRALNLLAKALATAEELGMARLQIDAERALADADLSPGSSAEA